MASGKSKDLNYYLPRFLAYLAANNPLSETVECNTPLKRKN